MGWGILEDPRYPNIPGTIRLADKNEQAKNIDDDDFIEPKKLGDITLVPQPSDSPNDPLNWSPVRKNTILFLLALTAGVTVSLGPMITTGDSEIEKDFNVTADQISFDLVGLLQMTTGSGTFFTAAAAAIWGKRPVFFISTIALFATNAWGFFATSFTSLTIMRFLQGFAAAPLETLVSATISEIFFVHERGKRLSIWTLFVMAGVKLGQLVASFIIQALGFKFTFGFCALIYAAIIPLMYFFLIETVYKPAAAETVVVFEKSSLRVIEIELPEPKKSFRQEIQLFQGRLSDASFWRLAYKPVPLVTFPAVIYAAFTYSSYSAGLTLIALIQDGVFGEKPYNLTSSQIGLTNLPLFAVGLCATLSSGYCADFVVGFMAKRNKGVYEPEFRLVLMIVAAGLATVAYIGFGVSVAAGAPIAIPVMFLGVQTFAVPFATSATFTYVMDCHPAHAPQAFVTMNFIKAVISLLMSNFVNGLLTKLGAQKLFLYVAILNLALSAPSLGMYIFGKRLRSYVARSPFHQKI